MHVGATAGISFCTSKRARVAIGEHFHVTKLSTKALPAKATERPIRPMERIPLANRFQYRQVPTRHAGEVHDDGIEYRQRVLRKPNFFSQKLVVADVIDVVPRLADGQVGQEIAATAKKRRQKPFSAAAIGSA